MQGPKLTTDFDAVSYHYEDLLDESLKLKLGGEPSDYYLILKANELIGHCRRKNTDPSGLSLLDVGCGTGRMLEIFRPQVGRVAGAEPSEGMLERAKQRLPGVALERGSAESLPFGDASFDIVTSACIFHHSRRERFNAMIAEMIRVLKPGGLLFTFEHNPWNPLTQWVVSRCPVDAEVVLVRPGEILRAYSGAGLKEIEKRYIVFFPNRLRALRVLEPSLYRVPLGGQYYFCGRKPLGDAQSRKR